MPGIAQETIDQIKQCGMLSLAREYTDLRQISKNLYCGKCPNPAHNDNTPSFFVMTDGEYENWCCYGCHSGTKGGDNFGSDNIAFLQWIYSHKGIHLGFKDAVSILAQRFGVPMEEDPNADIYRENLRKCKEYVKKLNEETIGYLASRGISQEDIKKWGIGYDGERITFPIFNRFNYVSGFTKRIFPERSGKEAKYINSKTSEVFNKKKILYGLHALGKSHGDILITEGVFDVILAHHYGIHNIVATLTCNLSNENAETIKKLRLAPVLCYDGDSAGAEGVRKAVATFHEKGIHNVKILPIPQGQDMADLALRLRDKLGEYIEEKQIPYPQYVLQGLADQFDAKLNSELQALSPKVQEALSMIDDDDERGLAKSYISRRLKLWTV